MTLQTTLPSKNKVYVTGALLGAVIGGATAFLLVRTAESEQGSYDLNTADLFKVALNVVTAMRGVAALGNA